MINTSKLPTEYDIECKARLLARLANTAATQAREVNYDTPKQTIDTLSEFCELLDDAAKELYILCSVHSGFANFTDFDECAAIFGQPAGADAQDGESE
jgi:hypothetical protein